MWLRDRLLIARPAEDVEQPDEPGRDRPRGWRRLPWPALTLHWGLRAGIAVLFFGTLAVLYRHLSSTVPITSDNAFMTLEAQDVLHGNVLLSGWVTAQDTFTATDLPVYLGLVLTRGVSASTSHDASTITYLLLVAVVVLLARGWARGNRGWLQMLIAFGVIAAPTAPLGPSILLIGPYHAGTALFILLALLSLDVYQRWDHPAALVAYFILLTLAVSADPLALYAGAVPVIVVCALRLLGDPRRRWKSDLVILVLAGAAAVVGTALTAVIVAAGGYHVIQTTAQFVPLAAIPQHVQAAVDGYLMLFGADFFGAPIKGATAIALLRAAGCAFVAIVACVTLARAVRHGRRPRSGDDRTLEDDGDLVTQLLLAVVVVNLAAFLCSTMAFDAGSVRYLLPAVMSGAALAGRASGFVLVNVRRRAVAAILAIALIAFLPLSLREPSAAQPQTPVVQWLQAHDLHEGLGSYWSGDLMTVASGDQVRVRAVAAHRDGLLGPYQWETNQSWYRSGDARFVVIDEKYPYGVDNQSAIATFGPPARTVRIGTYLVLIWNHNLLPALH